MLFLHGFLGTGADWAPIVSRLSITAITPDLPGHGETPLLPKRQSYATWVNWLAAFLAARHLPPAHLVGYSLGGRVALAFALAYPYRIRSLVLESTHPGLRDPAQRAQRARLDAKRAAYIRKHGLRAFLEEWYSLPLWRSLDAHPGLRERLITQRSRQNPEFMARIIAEMSPGVQPDLTSQLPQISFPVLIITGALDERYTQLWQRLLPRFSHAQVQHVVVPYAGHNVHLEQPEAYAAALTRFWSLAT